MKTPTQSTSSFSAASGKRAVIVVLCLLTIGASAWWMWDTNSAGSRKHEELHRLIGRVMADETVRVLNGRGKILLIAIDATAVPELKWQLDGFKNGLIASS